MKIPSLFSKTPQHRKFSYSPRFYDPLEEERKEREERIRKEVLRAQMKESGEVEAPLEEYRSRIAGSFRTAKKTASRQADPSASLIRLIILTFLALWLIAYLQFGNVAFYALLLFIPFYLFLKSRGLKRGD